VTFDTTGRQLTFIRKAGRVTEPAQQLAFVLDDVTVDGQSLYATGGQLRTLDNWLSYHPVGQHWTMMYEVNDATVEQYFIFDKGIPTRGDLVIEGRFITRLKPVYLSDEAGIVFIEPQVRTSRSTDALAYGSAKVTDAAGQQLTARMSLRGKRLRLTIPGDWLARAELPLTVDPVIGPAEMVTTAEAAVDSQTIASDGVNSLAVWSWKGDIYGQRIDANGVLTGTLLTINQADGVQDHPAITYNPQTHEYLVAWVDYRYSLSDRAIFVQRVAGDGTLSGNEVEAQSPAAGANTPALAASANGNYLLIWKDQVGGTTTHNIMAQLLDATAIPSGTVVSLETAGNIQEHPAVAYDSGQDIFQVVWTDKRAGPYQIYGQRVTGSGILSGPNQVLGTGVYPAIGANDSGYFLTTWNNTVTGAEQVRGIYVSTSDGSLSGSELIIDPDGTTKHYSAVTGISGNKYLVLWKDGGVISARQVTADGTLGTSFAVRDNTGVLNNNIHLGVAYSGSAAQSLGVWLDREYNDSYDYVVGRRISDTGSGGVSGAIFVISPHYRQPATAAVAGGTPARPFVMVWEEQPDALSATDIYMQPLTAQGQPDGAVVDVTLNAAAQENPDIAVGSNGYLTVWQDTRNTSWGTDIYGQRLDITGVPTGTLIPISSNVDEQLHPSAVYNKLRDEYLVVWDDRRNGTDTDIYGQRIAGDGGVQGGFNLSLSGEQRMPEVAYNALDDTYLVVWEDYRANAANPVIYGQVISSDGTTPGTDFAIGNATGAQYGPVVAYADAGNEYLVSWSDHRNYEWDIYGQVLSGSGSLTGNNFAISTATGDQQSPAMAAGDPGEFLVVWQDKRNGGGKTHIYAQRIGLDGALLDEPDTAAIETDATLNFRLSDTGDANQLPVTTFSNAAGLYLAAWNNLDDAAIYTQRYSSALSSAATAPILLVDDDLGAAYETYYRAALDALGRPYEVWHTAYRGAPSAALLGLYEVVIWVTGDDYDTTLDSVEQTALTAYLDGGGSLFISGQDIGYDIGATPFFGNYLHATYVQDDAGGTTLAGQDILSGLSISLTGGDSAGNQAYPSEIGLGSGATGLWDYDGTPGWGGLQWSGGYKVVYFAFGFEGINAANDRLAVLDNVLTWFSGTPTANFSATPVSGTAPLTVTFSNQSINATDYVWTFGDNITGTVVSPTHTYTQAGVYTVSLTATGPGGSSVITATNYITVNEPLIYLYREDFNSYAAGDNPMDWLDTQAGNSLLADDTLFRVFEVGGEKVFGTASTATNIHSHYVGSGSAAYTGYEYTGRLMMTDANGGLGVTLYSDYPNSDTYYRLRRSQYTPSFALSAHPDATANLSGVIDTGVLPAANTWYRFKVQVEDMGSQTEISAKVWAEGTAEPADWQAVAIDATTHQLTAGTIGLWSMGNGNKYWDDIALTPLPTSTATATLTVRVAGSGVVTATPELPAYTYGQAVTLTAAADAGWVFSGWSGDMNGSDNPATLTMTGSRQITATFIALAPVAGFSAAPLSGTVPLTVTFSNESTNATDYVWTFGDNITGTVINPTHTYTQAGVYTVSLTATGPGGSSLITATNYITVSIDPFVRNWRPVTPTHTIPVWGEGAMNYDNARQRAVWYGGNAIGYPYETGMWEFDGSDWAVITPTIHPSARYGMAMVYDRAQDRLLLFGGSDSDDRSLNETWVYSATTTTWTQLLPATSPLSRTHAALTIDPANGKAYLFGGNDGETYFNDLWVYENGNWQPVVITGTLPAPRTLAAMAFNPDDGTLLLFGGRSVTGTALADTWQFDLATLNWQEKTVTGPLARYAHTLTYDRDTGRFILVGGAAVAGDILFDDTWYYTQAGGWEAVALETSPSPVAYHQAVYDETTHTLILVGRGEVWRYE